MTQLLGKVVISSSCNFAPESEMTEIWVYKLDGTVQCQPAEGFEITVAEMRLQLAALIGDQNILDEEKRGPQGKVNSLCGRPTGNVNAYKITPNGLALLFSGTAGPSGFEVDPDTKIVIDPDDAVNPWPLAGPGDDPVFPWPTKVAAQWKADDRWVPWPWAALHQSDGDDAARAMTNVISSLTQVGKHPTLIEELNGRRCRVYEEGDMITLDYMPERVNIVLSERRISRIWFG